MIDASPRRLQVFKCVVDLGGFNAAAARLGIAQPSVGAHVDALERQAGQPLLRRRRGARPHPTEAGRIVYELAAEVLRLSEETARTLAGLKSSQTSEIVIAAHRDLALSFLPQRLGAFSKRYPKQRVVTRIGTIDDVLALVESGAVSIGVLLASGAIAGLASEIVGHEPLELVVAAGHPLAGRVGLQPVDLEAFGFVTGLKASRYFRIVDRALKDVGLSNYRIALEIQEATAAKQAVRHGRSIACQPRCTVTDEIASGTLVALDFAERPAPLQIRCVFAASPTPMVKRLVGALKG